ncbi:porin [Vibrio hangzhouensis]|uniref:Outer membrane protein (Porin) n=1 Tax=Vibrio hangzhouensis TaxID=462991 RepID=A0A1H5YXN1_9VIBR|nr:porin [Vibrio hangzhouensis]SEG29013.1 Outer membrane protein (porin) [Vibrio hangzhouensis]
MKKTLVALAVLASAGSAQAIELYNQDKVTVNMTGDVEVVYLKDRVKDAELTQEIQDADFGFDTRYQVNDDLQIGAFWEFSGDGGVADTGDVYMAFYSQSLGSIKFGKTATALDDAGIGSDYQFGISSFFQNGTPFSGDEAIRYDLDKGTFYVSAAFLQDRNGNNGLGNDGTFFDAKAGFRVADFDFTGFVGKASFKEEGAAFDGQEETLYALEARWGGVENLNLAAGWYRVDGDTAGADVASDTFGISADYTFNAIKFAAGYSNSSNDVANSEDLNSWYLNAGYSLAPSTTAYVEVGGDDATDNELGYAIGLKAEF